MKKNKKKNNNNNIKILIISFILLSLIVLIIYSRNFRNFSNITLFRNNKTIYNVEDLVVNKVKYMDKENIVEKEFGKPNKEKEYNKNGYNYKDKEYNGLKITLKENYGDYVVVKVEVTKRKYKTGRNIRVGNHITKVFRKYKVANKTGSYMYGKYNINSIKDKSVTKEISFGYRDKEKVEYVDRDSVTNIDEPTLIGKVIYEYHYGKIKKITWSYDIE